MIHYFILEQQQPSHTEVLQLLRTRSFSWKEPTSPHLCSNTLQSTFLPKSAFKREREGWAISFCKHSDKSYTENIITQGRLSGITDHIKPDVTLLVLDINFHKVSYSKQKPVHKLGLLQYLRSLI